MQRTEGAVSGTSRFWSDNVVLGLATIVAGLFNTAYSVLLAHLMGPDSYGRIGALNNLVSLFLLPLPIIGLAAIRVGRQAHQQRLLFAISVGIGVFIFLLALWLSPSLGHTLHLPTDLIVLYCSSVILSFAYALYIGYLKRARQYGMVGLLLVLASAASVAAVVAAVTWGHKFPLFWLGVWQAVAVIVVFSLALQLTRYVPVLPPVRLRREVVWTTLGVGTLEALWSFTDVLFAKAHLSTANAGLYTGLSTIGQSLPFVVASLATVMLTAILDDPHRRRGYLTRTLLATVGLGILFVGILLLFPRPVVHLALGRAFIPMVPLIQRYSDAMVALSLVLVFATYGVAVGAYRTMTAAGLGTMTWIVLLAGARTMNALVDRTLISMVATLVLVGLAFWVGRGRQTGSRTHQEPIL
jgi:O-antigen/teichoic acid export membrane protein